MGLRGLTPHLADAPALAVLLAELQAQGLKPLICLSLCTASSASRSTAQKTDPSWVGNALKNAPVERGHSLRSQWSQADSNR